RNGMGTELPAWTDSAKRVCAKSVLTWIPAAFDEASIPIDIAQLACFWGRRCTLSELTTPFEKHGAGVSYLLSALNAMLLCTCGSLLLQQTTGGRASDCQPLSRT